MMHVFTRYPPGWTAAFFGAVHGRGSSGAAPISCSQNWRAPYPPHPRAEGWLRGHGGTGRSAAGRVRTGTGGATGRVVGGAVEGNSPDLLAPRGEAPRVGAGRAGDSPIGARISPCCVGAGSIVLRRGCLSGSFRCSQRPFRDSGETLNIPRAPSSIRRGAPMGDGPRRVWGYTPARWHGRSGGWRRVPRSGWMATSARVSTR
jgi:hypothetical protein